MLSSTLLTLASFATLGSAHYKVLYPEWRGDSLDSETASQWIWPCANVSETTNGTRTKWPTSGGSVMINGSHEFAFTYVNLGLGRNVTNFNISLVDNFNQTGAGALCLKDAVKESLKAGLKKSNISEESLEGMDASLQVIQIGHSGSSLYNCMDITFSKDAKLLDDDKCKNGTGVGGTAIGASEAQADGANKTGGASDNKPGAANTIKPFVGSGVVAAALALMLL